MLTAIGQLATVFIGVPSIIYFAIQLREQNRERRQSAVNALTVQWGELTKALHENAEFTAVYLRGVQSFHDLDAVSKPDGHGCRGVHSCQSARRSRAAVRLR